MLTTTKWINFGKKRNFALLGKYLDTVILPRRPFSARRTSWWL